MALFVCLPVIKQRFVNVVNLYCLSTISSITLLFCIRQPVISSQSQIIPAACFFVCDPLVTKRSPSLCSVVRRCHRLVWLSWLQCPPVSPTKELAWTHLFATSAPQRCCRSAGLAPFPQNYWPTWRKGEVQTASAPSCSGSQGQVSLIVLQGRRPRCDQERRLFS